jgi:hypothetical protein
MLRQRAIVGHNPGPLGEPKTAHPCDDGVSFFRVATGGMDQGCLQLFRSSHHQTMEEFKAHSTPPDKPILGPDRVLIARGSLKCEINPPAGCKLVWVGFSKTPVGTNAQSPHTLNFMADFRGRVPLPEPGSRVGRGKITDYSFH